MDSLSQIDRHTSDRQNEDTHADALHEIGRQIAASDHVHEVLDRVLDFTVGLVKCDSCFIYVLDENELVLRASKNPHADLVDRLKLRLGEGIAGWVAQHREPVALSKNAFKDPRFRFCTELPEDNYEALLCVPLLSRGRVVGVMSLQHRQPHNYSRRRVQLISTIGFLVGAEVEMARLEAENANLSEQLETRKLVERAKGILQRELNLDEEQAYLALQRQSRQKRKPMKEIAEAIVLSDEIKGDSRIN
ncbi:MAG TPA: GAF domain-containing protein [Terriglobales bacterium]|nr:GAF domain-containing protein [Terriglobales bacterium]